MIERKVIQLKNKTLENKLNKIIKRKIGDDARVQITTTINKELMDDYRELVKYLKMPINIGFDSLISLILNDDESLSKFLKEIEKR